MDCKVKLSHLKLSLLLLLVNIIVSVNGNCVIKERLDDSCTYTIDCSEHPSAVGNPSCTGELNVTLKVSYSTLNILTSSFFSSTDFDSRVRQLIVTDCYWRTIEATSFKYYSKCIYLDLSSNRIAALNNYAFAGLQNLRYMNLSGNDIQSLSVGSLNFQRELMYMQILDLSNNKLVSLKDNLFASLPLLLELYLQNNELETMDDKCLYNLKKLQILNLQYNKITDLNVTLRTLNALIHLDLSFNSITKLAAYEIIYLTSLEYFNVSNNLIEVVEENCFSQAFNLQIVDLRNNKIHSVVDNIFMNNRLLKYLNFFHNNITTFKSKLVSNNIEYINFEKNNLTGNISLETFKGLSHVPMLNISQQNIKHVNDGAFSSMTHLKSLNLSRNLIETMGNLSFSFEDRNSLDVLDISHNYLTALHFLRNFNSNLTELYLNDNSLIILQKNIFANHQNIKVLDVSNNKILVIEQNSLPLQNLQYFNVGGNRLIGNITNSMFSNAPFIRYLNLSHFKYKRIVANGLVNLPLLATLNISNNELEFIHFDNFKGMKNMYSMDLSFNNLTNLELNSYLDDLQAIYLNNNKFTKLPRIFSRLSKIIHIDLSHNNITDLDDAVFENISDIRILYLSYNRISRFSNKYTNALSNLSLLALNENHLSHIDLSYLKKLTYIDLSYNVIQFVNSSTFEGLESLQYLDLCYNKISEIFPGTFQYQKNLKFLNFSSNYITYLRYGSFKGLDQTDVLDLSKNKLRILDILIFHECLRLRVLFIDYNYIKTIDLDKLSMIAPKLRTVSLGGNPMSCEEIVRTLANKNRSLTVTAMHKIYHDDNVHGIKCGLGERSRLGTETAMIRRVEENASKGHEIVGSNVTLIWCAILTVVVVVAAIVVFYRKYRKLKNRDYRMQFRNSLNNIHGAADLLS